MWSKDRKHENAKTSQGCNETLQFQMSILRPDTVDLRVFDRRKQKLIKKVCFRSLHKSYLGLISRYIYER